MGLDFHDRKLSPLIHCGNRTIDCIDLIKDRINDIKELKTKRLKGQKTIKQVKNNKRKRLLNL